MTVRKRKAPGVYTIVRCNRNIEKIQRHGYRKLHKREMRTSAKESCEEILKNTEIGQRIMGDTRQ